VASNIKASAPHENLNPNQDAPLPEDTEELDFNPSQMQFNFTPADLRAAPDSNTAFDRFTPVKESAVAAPQAAFNFASRNPVEQVSALAASGDIDLSRITEIPAGTKWRSLFMVAAPLILCLACVALLAYVLKSSPATAEKFLAALNPAAELAAPAGLRVEGLRYQRIALEKGDTLVLISGQIVNGSSRVFKDVFIEAVGFDAAGKVLAKTRLNANSTLAKTRVKSLSPEMIENIQGSKSVKALNLDPSEKHEFAIGLLQPEMAKAKFFTARVYSVRE
jgi:hypothetical protein